MRNSYSTWIQTIFAAMSIAQIGLPERSTTVQFAIFAMEIAAMAFGESAFAPWFSIRRQANSRSKPADQASKQIAEVRANRYGTKFNTRVLDRRSSRAAKDRYKREPQGITHKGSWQTAERIRGGNPVFGECGLPLGKSLRCEIYIDGNSRRLHYHGSRQQG